MKRAEYDKVEDGTYWAEIPDFEGLNATGRTFEECREDLKNALEGWLILGLWQNDETIPKLDNLDIVPRKRRLPKNESSVSPRTRKAS
jgi:predicted RNase H-like HicB family nuclease